MNISGKDKISYIRHYGILRKLKCYEKLICNQTYLIELFYCLQIFKILCFKYLDLEFPYVCCGWVLSSLVNKEAVLSKGRAEYSKKGNTSRDQGGKKAE